MCLSLPVNLRMAYGFRLLSPEPSSMVQMAPLSAISTMSIWSAAKLQVPVIEVSVLEDSCRLQGQTYSRSTCAGIIEPYAQL